MNTAQRLSDILHGLLSKGVENGVSAAVMWCRALGIDESTPGKDDEVVLAVQAYRAELDSVEAVLASMGFGPHLYKKQFDRIRSAASPYSLGSDWRGMVGNVNPTDVRFALLWAAAVMPDHEDELEAAELTALAGEFDQLSEAIGAANLPPAMQAYASKQIKSLRAALRMYKVRGIAAIQESVEQSFGAAQKAQRAMAVEAASVPEARTFVQRVNGGIARAMTMCDSAEKMHKGGSALLTMAEGLQNLLALAKVS
ncbi:hypothetical protein [Methylibium petroleiphilum]|uniref:hypothetical protein n=1 Tax=Methylibium petroleiphilum TaxID=105560 RepID=UPI003D2AF38B